MGNRLKNVVITLVIVPIMAAPMWPELESLARKGFAGLWAGKH